MELVNLNPTITKAMTYVIEIWERKLRMWSICIRPKIEMSKRTEKVKMRGGGTGEEALP